RIVLRPAARLSSGCSVWGGTDAISGSPFHPKSAHTPPTTMPGKVTSEEAAIAPPMLAKPNSTQTTRAQCGSGWYQATALMRPLTVKLRGRPMHQAALQSNEALQAYPVRLSGRRGRTISSSARGAKQTTHHGPLQRLLDFECLLRMRDLRVRPTLMP